MKKRILILVAVFIGVASIISCNDDDNVTPAKKIRLEKSSVTISVGEEKQVEITQGNGSYKVVSSASVVSATISMDKKIVLQGKSAGESNVTITDSREEKAVIKVTVIAKLNLPKEEVKLKKGEVKEFELKGTDKDFEVSTTPENIVKSEIKNSKLVLTAMSSGKVRITVTDKRTGKKAEMTVNVPEEIKDVAVNKTKVEVKEGGKEEVEMTAGSGNYEVKSSDKGVATAEVKDGKVVITGVKAGTTKVTITDTKTKKTAEITVKIIEVIEDVAVNKTKIEVKEGEKEEVEVTAGSGNYEVKSSDKGVATAEVKDGKVVITGAKAGTTKVTVTDTKTKKTAEITVKIIEVIEDVAVNKTKVEVKEGEKGEVEMTAGSGNYEVKSSDKGVATAEVKDGKVVITGAKVGTTKVTVTDTKTKKTAEITVVVSAKEVAYEDLTVEKTTVQIKEGETISLAIAGGSLKYEGKSEDKKVATAEIKEDKVVITAIKKGTTDIVVEDKTTKKKVVIKVTVDATEVSSGEFALEKAEITLITEETKEVQITKGSGNYEVSSTNTDVAKVVRNGNTIKIIAGKRLGEDFTGNIPFESIETTIKVTDTELEQSKEIKVKVFHKLSIGTKKLKITDGKMKPTTIVSGDLNSIKVTIQNEDIASYEIGKDINGKPEIQFTGLKSGVTTATISDGSAIFEVSITVKPKVITVEPSKDKIQIFNKETKEEITEITVTNDEVSVILIGGSGKYKVKSITPEDIIFVEQHYEDEEEFVITAQETGGPVNVTFADAEDENKTVTIKVIIKIEE